MLLATFAGLLVVTSEFRYGTIHPTLLVQPRRSVVLAAKLVAAALAGLVFVAISINIDRILKLEGIPERALETVITLLTVVLISITGLIPGQSTTALAVELLAIAATYAVGATVLGRRSLPVEVAPTRIWSAAWSSPPWRWFR